MSLYWNLHLQHYTLHSTLVCDIVLGNTLNLISIILNSQPEKTWKAMPALEKYNVHGAVWFSGVKFYREIKGEYGNK